MKDKLLVFVSFPGSGEGCSSDCDGLDGGGMEFAGGGVRGVIDGIDCLEGRGGL